MVKHNLRLKLVYQFGINDIAKSAILSACQSVWLAQLHGYDVSHSEACSLMSAEGSGSIPGAGKLDVTFILPGYQLK